MQKILFFYTPGRLKSEPFDKINNFFSQNQLDVTICTNYDVTISEESITENIKNLSLNEYKYIVFYITKRNRQYEPLEQYLLDYCEKNDIPNIVIGYRGVKTYKIGQFKALVEQNLSRIPSLISSSSSEVTKFMSKLSINFPIIAKPYDDSEGGNVDLIKSITQLEDLFKEVRQPRIIQPFLENDGDYRVWVIRNEIVGVIKREPSSDEEFRSNIALGGRALPAKLPQGILNECIQFVISMNLDCAGVDVIQDKTSGKYYLLECNSPMGREGFTSVTGINLFEYLANYISKTLCSTY